MYNLQKEDIIDGANLISKAFLDDPKIVYFFPNKGNRIDILHYLWAFLLKDGLRNGKVYAPTSKLEGIIIWYPPNKVHISVWQALVSGVLKVVRKFGVSTIKKMNQANKVVKDLHIKLLPKPHWYLVLLAVDPQLQKKGYASQLINFMFEEIETKREPIYLETNNHRNISLYEHFGFNIVEKLIIPNTKIVNWSMIRY